ncbi:MAG TPA: NAD(P)H-dependent oxidoreductase [Trichocoleus sp.]
MAHLLHLDASPRGDRSLSRRLTHEFATAWKQAHPEGTVTYRDVGRDPVPPVDEAWVAAAYVAPERHTPQQQAALSISNRLVDELLAADLCVLGTPMYNFSIPSALKAYIDQIVRIGRTFAFDPHNSENPYQPLVTGKQLVIIATRGGSGFGVGGANAAMNFQTPYLSSIFGFLGITDVAVVEVENDEVGGQTLAAEVAAAQAKIAHLAGA